MNLCIEFDGVGHFKPIQYRKGQDKDVQFAKIKARDALKDKLIPEHGMRLLRFPWYVPLTKESVRTWLIENGVSLETES
jgi:very-short-patch-repair endonuclease